MRWSLSLSCLSALLACREHKGLQPENERVDRDEDGYSEEEGDCDDGDPLAAPGEIERCDGLDNDCDGQTDQGGPTHACETRHVVRQTVRADVLVVLDVSESMAEAPGSELRSFWTRAASGAVEMLASLVGDAHDTHIGVITTDLGSPEGGGRLMEVGGRRFLEGGEDYASASSWLSQVLADQQPLAFGAEGVRDAIAAAITERRDAENVGFFREGANLDIIVVTNEEDPSEIDNVALLDLLWASGSEIRVHGIVQDDDEGCFGFGAAPSLHELVGASGGWVYDVCEENYGGFLASLSQSTARLGLTYRIELPAAARPDSVTIATYAPGGDPQPWLGSTAVASNGLALYFLDEAPPAGHTIVVDYRRLPTLPARP